MSLILTPSAQPHHQQRRRLDTQPPGAALDIALINNMPDAALRSTERQFAIAVEDAAGRMTVRLHLFAMASVSRSDETSAYIADHYRPLDEMLAQRFDALIVTGNEPKAERLDLEPYWNDMVRVIEWADRSTFTSLWSCLAAHAAVLHMHGIQRRRLPTKLSGVFECSLDTRDPLFAGSSAQTAVPHSRWNALDANDLASHDYTLLSESPEAGVDTFTWEGRSRFVFLQGHPEYEVDSLLREFRRDVGRFLRGEIGEYPNEPHNYFSPEACAVLQAFKRRARSHTNADLFGVFPQVASPFAIANRWQPTTRRLYRNWLTQIVVAKEAQNARSL